jgi:hypothetical protein
MVVGLCYGDQASSNSSTRSVYHYLHVFDFISKNVCTTGTLQKNAVKKVTRFSEKFSLRPEEDASVQCIEFVRSDLLIAIIGRIGTRPQVESLVAFFIAK